MTGMRAVIYQHEREEPVGLFGELLLEAGFSLVKRFRAAEHQDSEAELLVVFDGSMSAGDLELHPFLRDELSVLSFRLSDSRPCLGFGLGAQLLASSAGAPLLPGKNGFEVGVSPVRWTKEALADPVIAGVRAKTPVAHWHGDTYGPVPEATLLASTDRYTQQAFRLGDSFGFQFHPELTSEEFGRRIELRASELSALGVDAATLVPQLPKLKAAEVELSELLRRLAHHFASAVRKR